MQVNRLNFSDAIIDLGLDGAIDAAATEFAGRDVGGVRVGGTFSALIELREALLIGDERDITAAAGKIDESLTEVTRVQGRRRRIVGRAAKPRLNDTSHHSPKRSLDRHKDRLTPGFPLLVTRYSLLTTRY